MAEQYDVKAKVISQKGHCAAGHKVGDEYELGEATPAGMCPFAYFGMFPSAMVLQYGGSFPWEEDQEMTTFACQDAENPVVFELRRVRE